MPASSRARSGDPGSVTLPTTLPVYSTSMSKFSRLCSGFASTATSVSTAALSLRGFASFAVADATMDCRESRVAMSG